MVEREADDRAGQATPAVVGMDENIREPGESRSIRDDTAVADLLAILQRADNQRGISRGLLDFLAGNPGTPIRLGQPRMNNGKIDAAEVIGDEIVGVSDFHPG